MEIASIIGLACFITACFLAALTGAWFRPGEWYERLQQPSWLPSVGPHRYVMQRRLERAKTLVRRGSQPLAVIAQEAGFADQSHLTSLRSGRPAW